MRSILGVCAVTLGLTLLCFTTCGAKKNKKASKVLTYSAWLHESLQYTNSTKDQRRTDIIKALRRSDADLVCLQEVYFGSDVEEITKGLQSKFPFSYSGLHTDVNDFPPQSEGIRKLPCNYERVQNLEACMAGAGCYELVSEASVRECFNTYCLLSTAYIFLEDTQECMNCVIASLFNLNACANNDNSSVVGGRQMNTGTLLLLSTTEIREASYIDFHPDIKVTLSRGYLKAEVDDVATVRCTNLNAGDSDPLFEPYLVGDDLVTNSDLNKNQTKSLIRSLHGVQPAVILGNLNSGLAFKSSLQSNSIESYALMLKRFTTKPVVGYTFREPYNNTQKMCIDHVFVRNMIIRKTERMFLPEEDEPLLSNHIGVQAVVKNA